MHLGKTLGKIDDALKVDFKGQAFNLGKNNKELLIVAHQSGQVGSMAFFSFFRFFARRQNTNTCSNAQINY